ncbi:Uncharacterized protein TCM_027349 [Theobroma cacao]|uniref:Uncharacterized protein n=1 Tax=Theobroma cacao TaxID=3641 RepID=A0A061G9Y7_THECC|nr:Uncharacterized protein TCM_027349 [Theobroma cacao]
MTDPIPTLDKVYSLVLREETQKNLLIQSQPVLKSVVMAVMSDEKKKYKKEGKNAYKKGKLVNCVATVKEKQFAQENEAASNNTMFQMSLIKQQVSKLMNLLNESGISIDEGKDGSTFASASVPASNQQNKHSLVNFAFSDIGATDHISYTLDNFVSAKLVFNCFVELPNKVKALMSHIGTVKLTPFLTLTNDFVSWKVIRVAKVISGLYFMQINVDEQALLKHSIDKIIKPVSVYSIHSCRAVHSSFDLWHFRLVYPMAKQKKMPIPTHVQTSVSPFEIVHANIWGPYEHRKKFDKRASKCIFLGYPNGVKGYKNSYDHTFYQTPYVHESDSDFLDSVVVPSSIHALINMSTPSISPSVPSNISKTLDSLNSSSNSHEQSISSSLVDFTIDFFESISSEPFSVPSDSLPTRRSDRPRKLPKYLESFTTSLSHIHEPTTYHQAMQHDHWRDAMAAELAALEDNGTWSIVPLPVDSHAISYKWVFKTKMRVDGSIERFKARLSFLALVAAQGWYLSQLDINNAFLNGDLDEEVYMSLPPSYQVKGEYPSNVQLVCILHKSLYGLKQALYFLKQASRQWNAKFTAVLIEYGFKQSLSYYFLFTMNSDNGGFIAPLVYVDDIIIGSSSPQLSHDVKSFLSSHFKLKRPWREHGLLGAKPMSTPIDYNHKLEKATDEERLANAIVYRQLIGKFLYLTFTRPDISYAAQILSQFMDKPGHVHMMGAYRILKYLKGLPGQGILLNSKSNLQLSAYSDNDWVGCPITRSFANCKLVHKGFTTESIPKTFKQVECA